MKYKKIFFVGIEGVGMANLAILAHQAGFDVAGSDGAEEFINDEHLKKEGITVSQGFEASSIHEFARHEDPSQLLIIYTGAHGGSENLQVKTGNEIGIDTLNYGKALGEFMSSGLLERSDIQGISVTASHGKTTISAMVSCYL